MSRALAIGLAAGLVALSGMAHAQGPDPSAATELFRQGRVALDAKDYATACPKLEASLRLDPHVGTLISLAECEEATDRIAAARGHWQQAVDLAHGIGDQRESFAATRFAALDERVPRLTLRRSADAPLSTVVVRDDVELGGASFDVPLPVEAGPHVLVARAEGFEPRTVNVVLAEHESKELVIAPGPALPPPPPPVVAVTPAPTVPEPSAMRRLQRPIAIGLAASGVVAIGVGTGFGIAAIHGKSLAASDPARNTALTDGDVSTGVFIGAGALLAAAATLWFTAPRSAPKALRVEVVPEVSRSSAGVVFRGSL